jgi:hypothetical protein
MPTKEEWLDHMQVQLNVTVLISSLICTRIHADAIFEYDTIEYQLFWNLLQFSKALN